MTRIIVQNLLKSSIFTHINVHIPKYNYSYNCTNLLKAVIYLNISKCFICKYTSSLITLMIVCIHVLYKYVY